MSSVTSSGSAGSELARRVLAQFPGPGSERNIRQIFEAVIPSSITELRATIEALLCEGVITATYRVHSPFGRRDGLEDFEDLQDIPPRMEDDSQDPPVEFAVGLADVEVVFSRAKKVRGVK